MKQFAEPYMLESVEMKEPFFLDDNPQSQSLKVVQTKSNLIGATVTFLLDSVRKRLLQDSTRIGKKKKV